MSRLPSPMNEVKSTVEKVYAMDSSDLIKEDPVPKRNFQSILALPEIEPLSEVRIDASSALNKLFPGDPLVCIGATLQRCCTKPLSRFTEVSNYQFIVPSPMRDRWAVAKSTGRKSPRALNNVGPRRWVVVECDFSKEDEETAGRSSKDLCLSVLSELSRYRPLACVVDSGGKSLHGWFVVYDDERLWDTDSLKRFLRYSASLGGDRKTWTKNQLVRLPGGTRDTGATQKILLWNEDALL